MRIHRRLVTAAALAAVAVLTVSTVQAASPVGADTPYFGYPPQPDYVDGSCFWGPGLNWHLPEFNTAGPDTGAIYWYTKYQLPPHAQQSSMSLNIRLMPEKFGKYTCASAAAVQSVAALPRSKLPSTLK